MGKLIQSAANQQIKLAATFVNNIGVGFIIAGIIAPGLSMLTDRPMLTKEAFLGAGLRCAVLGVVLHLLGRSALRRIQ
ncbi:hypothetical protein FLL57_17650 [Rhodopseudomonas palustris]|uniref:hypothetical protein n=1 Tax=Rhodopseudomonas palustris TaxID=1076 RepID=UPI00115DEFE6|nr:hypothetical protein [Rhodopseudomonas palustris]QDL99016.1 hypothetical protein FLL57_17650 [Rhodopseudomonas palustris]